MYILNIYCTFTYIVLLPETLQRRLQSFSRGSDKSSIPNPTVHGSDPRKTTRAQKCKIGGPRKIARRVNQRVGAFLFRTVRLFFLPRSRGLCYWNGMLKQGVRTWRRIRCGEWPRVPRIRRLPTVFGLYRCAFACSWQLLGCSVGVNGGGSFFWILCIFVCRILRTCQLRWVWRKSRTFSGTKRGFCIRCRNEKRERLQMCVKKENACISVGTTDNCRQTWISKQFKRLEMEDSKHFLNSLAK